MSILNSLTTAQLRQAVNTGVNPATGKPLSKSDFEEISFILNGNKDFKIPAQTPGDSSSIFSNQQNNDDNGLKVQPAPNDSTKKPPTIVESSPEFRASDANVATSVEISAEVHKTANAEEEKKINNFYDKARTIISEAVPPDINDCIVPNVQKYAAGIDAKDNKDACNLYVIMNYLTDSTDPEIKALARLANPTKKSGLTQDELKARYELIGRIASWQSGQIDNSKKAEELISKAEAAGSSHEEAVKQAIDAKLLDVYGFPILPEGKPIVIPKKYAIKEDVPPPITPTPTPPTPTPPIPVPDPPQPPQPDPDPNPTPPQIPGSIKGEGKLIPGVFFRDDFRKKGGITGIGEDFPFAWGPQIGGTRVSDKPVGFTVGWGWSTLSVESLKKMDTDGDGFVTFGEVREKIKKDGYQKYELPEGLDPDLGMYISDYEKVDKENLKIPVEQIIKRKPTKQPDNQ